MPNPACFATVEEPTIVRDYDERRDVEVVWLGFPRSWGEEPQTEFQRRYGHPPPAVRRMGDLRLAGPIDGELP